MWGLYRINLFSDIYYYILPVNTWIWCCWPSTTIIWVTFLPFCIFLLKLCRTELCRTEVIFAKLFKIVISQKNIFYHSRCRYFGCIVLSYEFSILWEFIFHEHFSSVRHKKCSVRHNHSNHDCSVILSAWKLFLLSIDRKIIHVFKTGQKSLLIG